jgi:hypothetical protein
MRKLFALLCLAVATLGLPAQAEPRTLLAVSGDWRLYRDTAYEIDWRNGGKVFISGACVAETVQVQTTMNIVALPPNVTQGDPALTGQLILRVSVAQWNYAPDAAQLIVTVMDKDHKVRKTFYNGPWITALMGNWADKSNPFARAAAIWGEEIQFKDRQQNDLTSVRAGGLNAIYPRLLACGRGE